MEKVFEQVGKDEELKEVYQGKNFEILSKKYAYYLAGHMGGGWTGRQDLDVIHDEVN